MKPQPLNPQPAYAGIEKFVLIKDPWHADAFKGTPAEGVVQSAGPRRIVWAAEDWCGNIVYTLAEVPPSEATGIERVNDVWCWI